MLHISSLNIVSWDIEPDHPMESEAFVNDPVCQLENYLTEPSGLKLYTSSLSDEEIRLRSLELVSDNFPYSRDKLVAYSIAEMNYVKNGYYPIYNSKKDISELISEEMLIRLHKEVSEELAWIVL